MKPTFRKFQNKDYTSCEALVNEAWDFENNFKPLALANLAKLIYTKGALLNSNFMMVAEMDGKVAGFIFGLNESTKKPRVNLFFGLKVWLTLLFIKPILPNSRKAILNAFSEHEKNRFDIVGEGKSEIVLFVVAKEFQSQGIGKKLWSHFLTDCQLSEVRSIVVETNRQGAASYYEQLGFKHVGDFDSPVHAFVTAKGQACMYEYSCE